MRSSCGLYAATSAFSRCERLGDHNSSNENSPNKAVAVSPEPIAEEPSTSLQSLGASLQSPPKTPPADRNKKAGGQGWAVFATVGTRRRERYCSCRSCLSAPAPLRERLGRPRLNRAKIIRNAMAVSEASQTMPTAQELARHVGVADRTLLQCSQRRTGCRLRSTSCSANSRIFIACFDGSNRWGDSPLALTDSSTSAPLSLSILHLVGSSRMMIWRAAISSPFSGFLSEFLSGCLSLLLDT